jgi:predicted kinase
MVLAAAAAMPPGPRPDSWEKMPRAGASLESGNGGQHSEVEQQAGRVDRQLTPGHRPETIDVMTDRIVLVNGLPGAGKSTLATALAGRLQVPLLAKDRIKEAVTDAIPGMAVPGLGAAVMDFVWQLAASVPGLVVIESWWFAPRDRRFVSDGLRRCGSPAVVEVWCDVPASVARQRYAGRQRHPIHDDASRLSEDWDTWAACAEPLHVGEVLRVQTDVPVDFAATADRVMAAFRPATVGP